MLLEICEPQSLVKQRLRARSRKKGNEANREKKIYLRPRKIEKAIRLITFLYTDFIFNILTFF